MRLLDASQRLGVLNAASDFPSINGARFNLDAPTRETRELVEVRGDFLLLADKNVNENTRPLVRKETKGCEQ